jgi:hypothetical protein
MVVIPIGYLNVNATLAIRCSVSTGVLGKPTLKKLARILAGQLTIWLLHRVSKSSRPLDSLMESYLQVSKSAKEDAK